ncbi:MAG: hypothetical protein JSU99_00910 [Nitrospiraceae bacterium]|nr:MAG: hypothetical protein JSU99_00910 [Nitrospiraceae bacterium]
MNESAGVILMMNNYFHDVATALLLASAIVMWVIYRKFGANEDPEVQDYFLKLYDSITLLARFSLAWIILGGIPRTYFYTEFEWSHYAGKSQIPALIVKHILAFVFVGAGAHIWLKIRRKVRAIRGPNVK